MAEDILTPYFERFFTPRYLGSFQEGFEVKVKYFTSPDAAPVEMVLKPYPFMTLYDLKVMIYKELRKEISAHPSFQCLLIPLASEVRGNNGNITYELNVNRVAKGNQTFDYSWAKPEVKDSFIVLNPFQRAVGEDADSQFVSESGKRTLSFSNRSRMLLEDYLQEINESSLTLHLYLYKDVVSRLRSELRTSDREWFGRISPYFPDLEINQSPTSLDEKSLAKLRIFDTYVSGIDSQMSRIDTLLSEGNVPLLPMVVAGCKFLRLVWPAQGKREPLEDMFYKLDVSQDRPFLRILPVGSTPTTKIKMNNTFKIPEISDPRLLRIWKDERNPKPDTDFMFSKLVIRKGVGSQPALYGTLRVFDDNSADFVILPPKQLKMLDPRSDLSALGMLMTRGLSGTPYLTRKPEIADASIICAVRLRLQTKLLTTDLLRKRLELFQSLFQEIPSLPGEKPLLMLRYRAVSNFAAEDKIYTFLTLMVSRTMTKGEAAMPELVVALEKEFQMTKEEAQAKVIYWWRNRGDIQLVLPETKDYIMTYNPGIDIAIFGQQSYYTIHLYRVDSKKVFDRILTAVSLLLSAEQKDLVEGEAAATTMAAVSNAVAVVAPSGASAAGPAVRTLEDEVPAAAANAAAGAAEENVFNSANQGDDIFLRLAMGAPTGDAEEEDLGLGEVLNMGNVANENAQANAANLNVGARVAAATATAVAGPPAPAPAPAPAALEPNDEEEDVPGKKKKSYQGWVKSQLQIADQRLFQYETEIAGRKIKKYVTMCQATESRQPFVLNQEQFDVMRETYSGDAEVVFVVYPLEQGEPLPQAGDEVYTLLKYGTNPLKQNYYLCCQFFCTEDYIMVREKDFYSTTDRQGRAKPNGSCPFCHKTEIKVLKSPGPNESVIQRRPKKGHDKRHLYVGFLQGETQHPEEFYMPCCFTEDNPLYISDPRFDKVREEREEEEVRTLAGVPTTSYQLTMSRAHKKYIVGPEKEALKISEIDGPQIGLLPSVLDKYFGQDPRDYVSREANKMELLPNAKCFLRVGVENRSSQRHDSFFSALAPYLDFRNTAEQVKARIKEVVTPRIFAFLNYGNLVLEFYDPTDPSPSDGDLRLWVSRELSIDMNDTNKDAVLRIWKSYHHFLGFLDSSQTKEYRQFAQMLALPGFVSSRGLVLIVLDLNEKNELSVRCPPFGYNIEQYSSSDVAFILHRSSGIWEPIFYSLNKAETPRFRASHQSEITFQRALEAGWPGIVKQRVAEFTTKCYSIGRSIYTSSSQIDPMALIPVSRLIEQMPTPPVGVIRDAYNHIVGLTFRAVAGKPGLVAVPVIDDEYMPITRTIHLDWNDYTPAPLDQVVKFYKEHQQIFALNPKYRIIRKIKSRGTDSYVAVQLENRLFVPAGQPKNAEAVATLDERKVDEMQFQMEWEMNRAIYFGKEESLEKVLFSAKESDMEEIFQHLRLTFANWFSGKASKDLRDMIKKIIDSTKIPVFERRKRLEVLLGPTILGWMDSRKPAGTQDGSLLRVDCLLHSKPPCPARCVWRQEAGKEVGQCLLHVPQTFRVGSGRPVNGAYLLMMRLLEELLRFPERSNQLRTGSVTALVALKEAVKIGEQYVLPEGSLAWQDLLRLDWLESGKEKKKFFEEFSRSEEGSAVSPQKRKNEEEEKAEETIIEVPMPDELKNLLGAEDPKLQKIHMLIANVTEDIPPLIPYLTPLGVNPTQLGLEEEVTYLEKDALRRLALLARRPIIYIDLTIEPPKYTAFGVMKNQKTYFPYVLVYTVDGTRVLSSSKEHLQDIRPNQMPEGLFYIFDNKVVGISE